LYFSVNLFQITSQAMLMHTHTHTHKKNIHIY